MELYEKLEVSWRRVKEDRRTDFIIGDFEYEVFEYHKKELLQGIADRIIKPEEYKPKSLRTIRVPKTSYTTRPGSVPEIEDRIYYQYLVDEIAEEIEEKLVPVEEKVVHSYRYNNRTSTDMFLKGRASYTTFEERTNEISKQFEYTIVTDVSSYFERIYHHELENTLRGLGATTSLVESLCDLLRKWRKGNSYSIPQGIWPSDYLGNIYLDPVDKFMMRKGYVYCRFVDDIRIGVNSYLEAQSVLLLLEEKLASLGLTLNDAKTKIIPSSQIEEVLFPHKQRIEEIKDEVKQKYKFSSNPYDDSYEEEDSEDEDVDLTSARELFREQLNLEYPIPSITRFCLKHLKNFQDEEILEDVINNLDRLVVVTPQVVNYLYRVYKATDEQGKEYISGSVASFVKDELTNYDWQIMWFLQLMSKFRSIGSPEVNSIREHIMNTNKDIHDAVLINALLLLGKHGDSADYEWILSLFDKNYSNWVKQGIVYSLRNMPITKRNHFYGYCIGQDVILDKVIHYIKKKF